jgi:hypothetical protein
MTKTARRRWSREIESEVDGIAIGSSGPVLLHGYDPPAGGMWIDSAIPGKVALLDRGSGERVWSSPCEIGYGRGFGAGFGKEGEVIVLGPSSAGYRIVRMSPTNGALMGAAEIEAFDQADVAPDLCICVAADRVTAIDTTAMVEVWRHAREGERYHQVGRQGERVFVVYSDRKSGQRGLLCLETQSGEALGPTLAAGPMAIHDMAVDEGGVILVAGDLSSALGADDLSEYLARLAEQDLNQRDVLSLVALPRAAAEGDSPLWYEFLSADAFEADDGLEASISCDSGKLYLIRGADLEVRDALSGRLLGGWTVPGLDERVAWKVCEGAGLLAEETRISIFELPA